MAERVCLVCGRGFYPRTGQHKFCTPVCRARAHELKRAPVKRARYGHTHQKERASWVPVVASGAVRCPRCGEPILPGQRWDLGHDDESRLRITGRPIGLHPEHASCNRATASASTSAHNAAVADVRLRYEQLGLDPRLARFDERGWPVDDPGRNIFWGPPCDLNGVHRRWSRDWRDWRAEALSASS